MATELATESPKMQYVDNEGHILSYEPIEKVIRTEDYYALITEEKIENHIDFEKVGAISNPSTINLEIVSNISVIHPGGIRLQIVSTSEEDTLEGTGAQKIKIVYFNSEWEKMYEIITMDGTTPINTIEVDFNRIEDVQIFKVGSGHTTIGTITIKDTSATNIYAQIDIGSNIFPRCLHYVAPGCKSFVTDILVSSYDKEGIEFRLVVTKDNIADGGGKVLIGVYLADIVEGSTPPHLKIPIGIDATNSTSALGVAMVARGHAENQSGFACFVGYDKNC